MAGHMNSEGPLTDEGGRIEAQEVRSSRRYFYGSDQGKAARVKQSERRHRRQRRHNHRSHTVRRAVLAVIVLLLVATMGAAAYAGGQFYRSAQVVRGKASSAIAQANSLKGQIVSGDYEGAKGSAQQMAAYAAEMREITESDLWQAMAKVPYLGGDVQKVQALATVFEDLSGNALIPLTDRLSGMSFSAIVGTEGNIDVDTLVGLVDALGTVSDVIGRSADAVDALGEAKIGQVNEPLQKVRTMLGDLDDMAQAALKVLPVLPQMLGAGGQTRNYLILAVSPAEMRAGGGFAGSTGLLKVTDGRLELGEFSSFAGLVTDASVIPDMTEEENRVFGMWARERSDNLNVTPNFVRTGEMYSYMWERRMGDHVDGLISVDPVFLQRVLALTGGVTASNGWTVDGTNAAQMLMNTVYWEIPTDAGDGAQDALFAEVAQLSFAQFTSRLGDVGITGLADLIGQSAEDHRLQVWMADAGEEAIMDELGISGAMSADPTKPVLGVYLNDYTWAKMGWYLDLRTTVGEGSRNEDGSMTYPVTTTVRNAMTPEEAAVASAYTVGLNPNRPEVGAMHTQLLIFAPAGGSVLGLDNEGRDSDPWYTSMYGLNMVVTGFWVGTEETATVTYTVTTSPEATEPLALRTSPTARTFE